VLGHTWPPPLVLRVHRWAHYFYPEWYKQHCRDKFATRLKNTPVHVQDAKGHFDFGEELFIGFIPMGRGGVAPTPPKMDRAKAFTKK